jgi:hypothetical protein
MPAGGLYKPRLAWPHQRQHLVAVVVELAAVLPLVEVQVAPPVDVISDASAQEAWMSILTASIVVPVAFPRDLSNRSRFRNISNCRIHCPCN